MPEPALWYFPAPPCRHRNYNSTFLLNGYLLTLQRLILLFTCYDAAAAAPSPDEGKWLDVVVARLGTV